MTVKFDEVREWAFSATMEEMKQISDLFRLRQTQIGAAKAMAFKKDDAIWFDGGRRGIIHGKFVKMRRKNAEVLADNGLTWTVSPQILNKVNT